MYYKKPDLPYILTFRECQSVLKCGKSTLLQLIHSGQLEAFQLGNRWKIRREALLTFLDSLD